MENKSYNSMVKVLADMNNEAKFQVATLSGRDGLLVASSATNGDNPAKQSAVVAKLVEATNLMHSQLAFGAPAQLSFSSEDGRRLICRPFSMNGQELILAVLIPNRRQPYRHATNRAIALLRNIWLEQQK